MPARKPTAAEVAVAVLGPDVELVDGVRAVGGKPAGLIARLTYVMAKLPDVSPEGRNEHFKYNFITDKQILGLVRPRLAQQNILVIPEILEEAMTETTTAKGGRSYMTRMRVQFTLVDGFNGEVIRGSSMGYGDDSGDKGANKAYTAALKNFLIKLFLIGGDTDLESDASTDERAAARERGSGPAEVKITPAKVEGVKPGGRQTSATETQVTRVGQYIRELNLEPDAVVALVEKAIGDKMELGEKPWDDIKDYLNSLSGEDIGKLIALMSKIDAAVDTVAASSDQA